MNNLLSLVLCICLLSLKSVQTFAECEREVTDETHKSEKVLVYKISAIVSILISSCVGICIPIVLKNNSSLQPNKPFHFIIKSFVAGIILATGFVHVLPDAFDSLTNPCLNGKSWKGFPFAGLIAMVSAIATLVMESFATGYHRRAELRKAQPVNGDEETIALQKANSSDLIRNRIISQVLELGIVVHSVIIGISMGTTENLKIIKALIAALSFHQFFEGMGLGGCISQAKYKYKTIIIMVLFFAFTTPIGIVTGMSILKIYEKNSSTALAVEGVLNSASAGILIYMALVDLLAADFMNPVLQENFKLQFWVNFALVLGACCMSLLAIME